MFTASDVHKAFCQMFSGFYEIPGSLVQSVQMHVLESLKLKPVWKV